MSAYGPLLDALRGVRWSARRTVSAALPGAHRSRQRGTAGEFTEYRLYRQGDDPKQLDWKLLGRSDRAFVRLTDDRAVVDTWIVIDGSLSMHFPEHGAVSKWAVARTLAVGLASVAHASSDPVGLVVASATGVTRMSPRTRRGTVGEVARTLDALTCGGEDSLAPLLDGIPSSARVVIITDFLGDLDAVRRAVTQRSAVGAIVACVHVVATEELELPDGVFLARDPEERRLHQTEPRTLHRAARSAYTARFAAFRAQTARQLRAAGAAYAEVRTDASLSRAVRLIVAGASGGESTIAVTDRARGWTVP